MLSRKITPFFGLIAGLSIAGLLLFFAGLSPFSEAEDRPFLIPLKQVIPDISLNLRYATHDNWTGNIVPGYEGNITYLVTPATAQALLKVETKLRLANHRLEIYDCYRPQVAVDFFYQWSREPDNPKQKDRFYPNEDKRSLFQKGYIAKVSQHQLGNTVDVSILRCTEQNNPNKISTCQPVNMGTWFDYFDVTSYTASTQIGEAAQRNRKILKTAMESEGFTNLPQEWWHYSLLQAF